VYDKLLLFLILHFLENSLNFVQISCKYRLSFILLTCIIFIQVILTQETWPDSF
jgi:hypothetical protein